MTKQVQKATDGSTAIQSGGDTTINVGLTAPQVVEIVSSVLQAEMSHFKEIAKKDAQLRTNALEKKLVERFNKKADASSEALKDPDFVYLLGRAQHAYARSGEEVVADTIVDLIARRSLETQRSRLSLTLNEAVEKTALLTNNEFAELSLSYLLRYTKRYVYSLPELVDFIRTNAVVLLPNISTHSTSYSYLVAQGCASIDMGQISFYGLFTRYEGLFSRGFNMEDCEGALSEENRIFAKDKELVMPCLNDPSKFQLNAMDMESFVDKAMSAGMKREGAENWWRWFKSSIWTEEEFLAAIAPQLPEIHALKEVWDTTSLKNLTLTPVGIAIGFSNLRRVSNFDADLSIWVK